MKLFIDTSSNKKTVVRFGIKTLEKSSSFWHSQVVLPMIAKLCPDLKNISGIEVRLGPGSFTGIRVGNAVANALRFALGLKF